MEKNCLVNTNSKNIKSFNFWKPLLGITIGGVLGYLYYAFVGCSSGACAITGNPYYSIIFGGFMGFMFVNRPCKSC
jgi:hypothetical protein